MLEKTCMIKDDTYIQCINYRTCISRTFVTSPRLIFEEKKVGLRQGQIRYIFVILTNSMLVKPA